MQLSTTYLAPEKDSLLRLPQVLTRVPVSRAAWWKGVKDGRYPSGHKLGPKTTCWLSSDIDKLIAKLASDE
ncbi:AlpA family phage regulatory protein [Variovorax sp. J22R133]|uniref:helix-turn-helix transcriptional regulator n=1 Tax=Variovorax brevis TaxID=3053503 RepID=UPI002574DDC1|nr:AlpA family phage regulatory protein [Variovorax sp. J22R133]MDM0113925.1 AlpA family phage regulatory protein [Variovorax sp. J22R133]